MPAARRVARPPKPVPPPPLWWEAFSPLSSAERLLRDAARDGEDCNLLESDKAERVIRPAFFRALCLRGGEIDPKGISVTGAVFTEPLDLARVDLSFGLTFTRCDFQAEVSLEGATTRFLYFYGGSLTSLNAEYVRTATDFYLKPTQEANPIALTISATVNIGGAKIGGQFSCTGAKFNHPGENCLFAQGLEAGDVLLSSAEAESTFAGQVSFNSAKITSDVFLRQATFAGQVNFDNAELGGSLFTERAVFQQGSSLVHAHVGKRFSWYPAAERAIYDETTKARRTIRTAGTIDLRNAHVDTWDDGYAFEQPGKRSMRDFCVEWLGKPQGRRTEVEIAADKRKAQYRLEGFVYERFAKEMPVDAGELSWWLRLADEHEYHPQPFERTVRVLREMGHESEARQIAIAQRIQRRRYQKRAVSNWEKFVKWLRCSFEFLSLDIVTRYGYRPFRAVAIAIVICLIAGTLFGYAYRAGAMVPANQDALTSIVQRRDAALVADRLTAEQRQANAAKPPVKRNWTVRKQQIEKAVASMPEIKKPPLYTATPGGYPYFNTAMYTLDVFLPIIELHQQEYWIPDRSRPGGGGYWSLLWFVCIAGWLLSTLFAVSFTGIVKTE